MSACHNPAVLVATTIATLIGSQRGGPMRSFSTYQASESIPKPKARRPTDAVSDMRVSFLQPKASLDPNAKVMHVTIPAAAMIEPFSPNNREYRFDNTRGSSSSIMEHSAKQTAATGAIRPGLDARMGM